MLAMWHWGEGAIRDNPWFVVLVFAIAVGFFVFLILTDGCRQERSRRRKKIKRKISAPLANPMDFQHRK